MRCIDCGLVHKAGVTRCPADDDTRDPSDLHQWFADRRGEHVRIVYRDGTGTLRPAEGRITATGTRIRGGPFVRLDTGVPGHAIVALLHTITDYGEAG